MWYFYTDIIYAYNLFTQYDKATLSDQSKKKFSYQKAAWCLNLLKKYILFDLISRQIIKSTYWNKMSLETLLNEYSYSIT